MGESPQQWPSLPRRVKFVLPERGSRFCDEVRCTTCPLDVPLRHADGSPFTGEYRLFASGSPEPVAIQSGSRVQFELPVPEAGGETRWYFVRAHGGENNASVAYLAPVWITAQ